MTTRAEYSISNDPNSSMHSNDTAAYLTAFPQMQAHLTQCDQEHLSLLPRRCELTLFIYLEAAFGKPMPHRIFDVRQAR